MSDRDIIMQRIVDRAVSLFSADNTDDPNRGGLFTTAHYGQAMKAEFRTAGPTLDGKTCAKHLSQMGDIVERAGDNIWRMIGSSPIGAETDESQIDAEPSASVQQLGDRQLKIEAEVESAVLRVFVGGGNMAHNTILSGTMWWSIEGMADALKNNDLVWDGHLENLVGRALYSMAVGGKVVSQPNMLIDGARVTVFAIAPKGTGLQPPFEGSPDDPSENFGNI